MHKTIPIVILLIALTIVSCKKSGEPTNPTVQVHLNMEIISYQDAPTVADSTLCYVKSFVDWNTSGWRDTSKADSLAQWFARSVYQITDMWFPNVDTRCVYYYPINTENIVTLRLAAPDTSLRSLGYSSTTAVVSPCYITYRHYTFTR